MMELFGFASKNSVFKLVNKLIADGFIYKDSRGRLSPSRLYGDLRVLGLVEAGFPSPAEEELVDTMSLDEYLIPRRDASFMLKVRGDSMKDAGICEGDMVIVERGVTPRSGDIVIAEVDNQWTMKYYQKDKGRVCLVPANTKYKKIYPEQELKIDAVVRAVVRKY